jgi:hypothetical protein
MIGVNRRLQKMGKAFGVLVPTIYVKGLGWQARDILQINYTPDPAGDYVVVKRVSKEPENTGK